MWQCNNGRVWHRRVNVTSHITRHHITYDGRLRHIWGTSSTTGGNNSRHICRDARFLAHRSSWCPPPVPRPMVRNKQDLPLWRPLGQHWILLCTPWLPFDCHCGHLNYLCLPGHRCTLTAIRWSSGHLAAHNLPFATVSALHLCDLCRKLQNS